MHTELVTAEQLLFQEEVRLTEVKEFGFSLQDLLEGNVPLPAAGVRFDIYFKGEVTGEQINGTIRGVDFLEVRADGRFFLNLQATLTTHDGVDIKVVENGINQHGQLRLNMNFYTADVRYAWLNKAQVLGIGPVDMISGEVKINAYLL